MDYLMGDLGAAWFLRLFSVDQSESNCEDEEKGQEKVSEIHGCLQCLCFNGFESAVVCNRLGGSKRTRPACTYHPQTVRRRQDGYHRLGQYM